MVIAVDAWMNHPGGFRMRNGQVTDIHPLRALVGNPYLWHEIVHIYIAGYIITGFLVAAAYAFGRMRGRWGRYERMALALPSTIAAVASPIQVLVGNWAGRDVATYQPTKLAALEGVGHTVRGAPEHLLGWYTDGGVKYGSGSRTRSRSWPVTAGTPPSPPHVFGLPHRRHRDVGAAGRVPVGNAAGNLFSSWLNPVSILIGVLAVATGAYLAAVVLCGDAHPLYHGLVEGNGLAALIASAVAGTATLALVWVRRFEPARYTAAVAVAAIVAGWALAQSPRLLPSLSVRQAAASLATLFRLALGGRLTEGATADEAISGFAPLPRSGWLVRAAIALLIAGIGLVNVADAEWAHMVGAACFPACIATAFRAAVPLA